jgi:beta-mannosidase
MATLPGGGRRLTIDSASLCITGAGVCATPADIQSDDWVGSPLPATAAKALALAGRYDPAAPTPLHDKDVWYRLDIPAHAGGTLAFDGVATIAEVWRGAERIATSKSMFERLDVPLPASDGETLFVCCRSLTRHLDTAKGPRGRWRAGMIPEQKLRLVRTTLLGHMPGWSPAWDVVGIWRPVTLIEDGARRGPVELRLTTDWRDGAGIVDITFALNDDLPANESVAFVCGDTRQPLTRDGERYSGRIPLPGVAPWWPAGYGAPTLHAAHLDIAGAIHPLPPLGFRSLALDRGADGRGFRLVINGVPIHASGAVWTPVDALGFNPSQEDLDRALDQVVAANLNMLRVAGPFVYESPAFHAGCDARGILVFQDLMLANFDYPVSDPGFLDAVTREADQLLTGLQASPSLVILSGGSEIHQQAAMLGLPAERAANAFLDLHFPNLVQRRRPDVVYIPSSPSGDALPFSPSSGVSHYYGVGAYERPLDDARRANVRFAAECLAFAHVPDTATLAAHLPVPALHHPRWKAAVPRDFGASWDFEDVRDHYLTRLFAVDPARLRREDPARYLAASRAVVAEVIEAVIDEFRRPGGPTGGQLIWFWRDLLPGAGWGVVDATGRPKSAWYALARAAAPLRVLLLDEGLDGLGIHILNTSDTAITGRLTLDLLRGDGVRVAGGASDVAVPPRGSVTIDQTALLGGFFDTTHAYRFGPRGHDLAVATLTDAAGMVLTEAFHRPDRSLPARQRLGLAVATGRDADGAFLTLSTEAPALHVVLDTADAVPSDNHFYLAPGRSRRITLLDASPAGVSGMVTALNGVETVAFRLASSLAETP